MSRFNLVVGQGDFSVPGDRQQCSKYGYITYHGLFCPPAKYDFTNLGYSVVVSIGNVDARQKETQVIWVELRYFMSVSNMLSYLFVTFMLLS